MAHCDNAYIVNALEISQLHWVKTNLNGVRHMEHDINLNIHYSVPDDIWEKIGEVYASMPYWSGNENGPHWVGNDIDIWASVEPGGIQIAGTMPDDIWKEWYSSLKMKLTDKLGYEIGEPEDGYEFKYFDRI